MVTRTHTDPLAELLRKCHRPELERLANRAGVTSKGLGLAQLAKTTALTLRRKGGNEIQNLLLRQGAGPPWRQVVEGVLSRNSLVVTGDVEQDEITIVRHTLQQALDGSTPDERRATWAQLGLPGPIPPTAAESAWRRLSPGFALFAAPLLLNPLVLPSAGAFALWWFGQPSDKVLLPAIVEVALLRAAVRHRVTVGVIGSPSTGKDAAIRALFGIDTGNISPVAGSTKTVEIKRLPGATALYIVNTPGLGDVVDSVTEEARQVIDHIDVYLYVVNAQGGVQQRERADYGVVRRQGRPVLVVVNKIDTLRVEDRARFLEKTKAQLGLADVELVPAAFDPLPQLADAPIGVLEIRGWITQRLLEMGKDPGALGATMDPAAAGRD